MGDLYSVLGLSPRASDREIKAAYRERVKLLHPDVNSAADAEQRIREVNRAYEVLGDRAARAAYDRALARRSPGSRWGPVTAAAASFLVTSGVVIAGTLWHQSKPAMTVAGTPMLEATVAMQSNEAAPLPAPAPAQPVAEAVGEPADHAVPPIEVPTSAEPAQPAEQPPPAQVAAREPPPPASTTLPEGPSVASWATYRNAGFGFKLSYPADVFAETIEDKGYARAAVSRDGRARLRISTAQNAEGTSLSDHRNALLAAYAGSTLHYAPKGSYWFVLSGTRGEEIFYHRVTLACDRKALHGWEVVFPAAERAVYEVIVDAMHRSYRHRNGPGARCGEPKREKSQPPGSAAGSPAPTRSTGRG